MEQEQGSGPNISKQRIEGLPEGGSTSSSNQREGDRALEGSQEPGTTSEQVERTRVTDNPNRVNDIAGLQTTGAHEDSDNSGDLDHTSEQGGGPLIPTEENFSSEDLSLETNDSTEGTVTDPSDQEDIPTISTGNADNQQTSDDWTIVDHVKGDAETVGKGRICRQVEKSDAGTVGKEEVCKQMEKSVAGTVEKKEVRKPMEKSDAGTVEKGEVCRQMEKNSGIINEVQQQITEVQSSLHSDDTLRAMSLKNDRPVVAKVSKTGRESAADNASKDVQGSEMDAQATREESCEASAASCQGLESPPVAVEFATSEPNLAVSKAQGVMVLSHSRSAKVTLSHPKPLDTLSTSKSLKETYKSPRGMIKLSNSLKGTSTSKEALSTVSISGTQKEINISSEAPSTGPSEAHGEVGMSQEDPITVSASAAQEEGSEISEAPNMVSISEAQKEVGMGLEDPSTVSRSKSLKEGFTSPKAASEVLAFEAQEGSSVISETPGSVPTSGAQIVGISQEALSVVPNSVVQKDVDLISEPFSTLSISEAQEEVSVSSEASSVNSEVPKDVGTSSGSPSTVPTPEAQDLISKSSETSNMVPNSEVQNEVGISVDAPNRACEAEEEINVSSGAPSTVSTSEAQKDLGTTPEEIISRAEVPSRVSAPEGLQRKASETGKEKIGNPLQKPPQQSETTVSIREGLPQARSESGKETSVPKEDARESDYSLTSTPAFRYEEQLAQKAEIIAELEKKANYMEARFKSKLQAMEQHWEKLYKNFEVLSREYQDLNSAHGELQMGYQDLDRQYKEKQTECSRLSATAQSYATQFARLKNSTTREIDDKEKLVRDFRGQVEQMKKEIGTLQDQMSLYEQHHANQQSRGGSYLDDTKAATPTLFLSALNGVKDASNNFVKVLRSSIHPGIDTAQLEDHIGAVSRNGHIKFQYQAYICRILFSDFKFPYAGSSKVVSPPSTYFRQYQNHDLKKTDTVERLLQYDREIDASLREFCFDKFLKLMADVQELLTDRSIDLKQQVQHKQHPRDSKLYVSFCKLAVSVWLLQRLAFSFVHPAKQFVAKSGEPFDLNRMQSVVPLDDPGSDEELQLRVGFYVLPGFDIGNSVVPCEVYVKYHGKS